MGGTRDHAPVEAQLQVAADRAIELARVRFGERLLDVCCGTGNASAAGAAAGALVTGIDLDESVIRIARERVPAGKFEIADAIHLPFANESFDVAVSTFGVSFLLGQAARRTLTSCATRRADRDHCLARDRFHPFGPKHPASRGRRGSRTAQFREQLHILA
jgi:SAM-dependent methyltransferase